MKLIKNYIEDLLICSGLGLIILATFMLSTVAGIYAAGTILLGLGFWFTRHPPEKR